MDITIQLTSKDTTTAVSMSISYCDTDLTMLHYIAAELNSLPSFLCWETTPTWAALATTLVFTCVDRLSYLRYSSDVVYPAGLPATEAFQRVFLGTHQLGNEPQFLQYFNSDDFVAPLSDLLDLSAYRKEQTLQTTVLAQRDAALALCRYADPLHIEDTTTRYKRFVATLAAPDVDTVFKTLVASKELPFVLYDGVALTHDYFKPPPDWLTLNSKHIVFKIRHDTTVDDYSTGVIAVDGGVCYCILDTSDFYKTVDEKALLTVLKRALKDEAMTLREQSTFLTYDVVDVEFHDCYMADMLMHSLHSLFYVDEYTKPSKASNRLYIHLADDTATVNLYQKTTQKQFQFNAEIGTPYIAVRIRGETVFNVMRAKHLVTCLLGYYQAHVDAVRDFYGRYVPPRLDRRPARAPDLDRRPAKRPLKMIAPDIFLPMYSRRCLNMPSIVAEADVAGRPSLKFPVFGESEQRIYVCEHEKYRYPGLRVNELSNRKQFPYVPCCYSKDQKLNPESKLNKYLRQKPVKPKIIHSRGAILNLPVQLKKYFTYVDPLGDYVALSNPAGPFSFLTAVYYALYKEAPPDDLIKSVTALGPEVCAQESWPTSYEEGLTPRRHIRLLETFFKISIFLFDKTGPVLPFFERIYLKRMPAKRSVLIYLKADQHCLPVVKTGASAAFLTAASVAMTLHNHIERLAPHPFTDQRAWRYFVSHGEIVAQRLNVDRHCIFFICVVNGVRLPIAVEPLVPFAAPLTATVERLTEAREIERLVDVSRLAIAVDGDTVKEIIVPEAPGARLLVQFQRAALPAAATVVDDGRRERYGHMDAGDGADIYRFVDTKRAAKELMRALAAASVDDKIPLNEEAVLVWLRAHPEWLPSSVAQHDRETVWRKLAFLIVLKRKNSAYVGGVDLDTLDAKPNTVVSLHKDVLTMVRPKPVFKPALRYAAVVGDSVLVSGRAATRLRVSLGEMNTLVEVIYYPPTDTLYDVVRFEPVGGLQRFKTAVDGEMWAFAFETP